MKRHIKSGDNDTGTFGYTKHHGENQEKGRPTFFQ
jgi:hypothetical protein